MTKEEIENLTNYKNRVDVLIAGPSAEFVEPEIPEKLIYELGKFNILFQKIEDSVRDLIKIELRGANHLKTEIVTNRLSFKMMTEIINTFFLSENNNKNSIELELIKLNSSN
jgi:hypothetical protein